MYIYFNGVKARLSRRTIVAISTVNPATGEEVRTFEALSEAEVDEKIQRAADWITNRWPFVGGSNEPA